MTPWTCRITCARQGHRQRLIDRLTLNENGDAELSLSVEPPIGEHFLPGRDHSTLDLGFTQGGDGGEATHAHHVLRCPTCSLEVRIGSTLLGQLARGLSDAGVTQLHLDHLAARLSKQ